MAAPRTALLWAILCLASLLCGMAQAQQGPSIPVKYCAKANTGFDADPKIYPIMSDFQSEGRCNTNCTTAKKAFAIVQEKACWCSDWIPAQADRKTVSDCNYPCPGYPTDVCGGDGVFGYLEIVQFKPVGTAKAGVGVDTTEEPPESTTSEPPPSATEPTVQTVTVGGTVRTVTTTPQATAGHGSSGLQEASTSSGLAGGAIAGIVVGVIGGLLVLAAFLFLLWKKRRQQHGARGFVSPMRGGSSSGMTGTSKGPMVSTDPIGWEASKRRSHLMPVDPRLDPFAKGIYLPNHNRSHDSISSLQDNQDYSRRVTEAPRVLRAINPDPDIP